MLTQELVDDPAHAIVLFDGLCNLCNASVTFIVDRDPRGYFRFASLQSEVGQALCQQFTIPTPVGAPQSVVLIESGRSYTESEAALRICRRLSGWWPLFLGLVIVPGPLRDAVYRLIARHRYRWFGRTDTCRVPTADLRQRFLDA